MTIIQRRPEDCHYSPLLPRARFHAVCLVTRHFRVPTADARGHCASDVRRALVTEVTNGLEELHYKLQVDIPPGLHRYAAMREEMGKTENTRQSFATSHRPSYF